MFVLQGRVLALDSPFTCGDVQYPANWLRLATPPERASLGIVEVPDPTRADDRFYWDGDINRPKDLDDLKAQAIAQVKAAAGSMLAVTDWQVTRAAEGVREIPAATLAARAAIRGAADANEQAIAACPDVAALAAVQLSWPQ